MPALNAIADLLNGLLAAERSSPFASVAASVPHAGRAGVGVRKAIRYIADADVRRARELWLLIESIGLEPALSAPALASLESYLQLSYVLPGLLAAKQRTLQLYRDATAGLAGAPGTITDVLSRHLTEHAGELAVLDGSQCE